MKFAQVTNYARPVNFIPELVATCHRISHECRRDNKQCGKAVWFRQLKPKQIEVISAFVGVRDVFVSLQLVIGNQLFMLLFRLLLKVILLYDI